MFRIRELGDILANVSAGVNEVGLLDLGGVYGDRNADDPVEHDHLRLSLTPVGAAGAAGRDGTVEITVFNRGITLFTSDEGKVRRIHRDDDFTDVLPWKAVDNCPCLGCMNGY